MSRLTRWAALAGAAAVLTLGAAAAVPASAASFSKAFDYQFTVTDSQTADSPGFISEQPFTGNAEASQSLGAGGVTLSVTPQATPAKGCCDSGVLVSLGDLGGLFDATGHLRPVYVTGTGVVYANWVFDTNGNGKPLSFDASGKLIDAGGDNFAYSDTLNQPGGTGGAMDLTTAGSAGAAVADSADFLTVLAQGNPALSGYKTLEQVHAAFTSGAVTGSTSADPQVWLDVLVYGQHNATATVASVDGKTLVTTSAPPPPPPPAVSSWGNEVNPFGNGFDVYRQRAAVNTVIAGWPARQGDPATHFLREAEGSAWRFEYAPHGGGTGLCVSNPDGGYLGDPAGATGLVLRGCNASKFQQFAEDSSGHLVSVINGQVVNPAGTGGQLRTASSPVAWGGSRYGWEDFAALPA